MIAIHQRSKGRDLFDIWYAMMQTDIEPARILEAWNFYMEHDGHTISKQEFIDNMEKKIADKDFIGDMNGLLRIGGEYNVKEVYQYINIHL